MPDFDFDETNPLNTSLISQYPTNERAHRSAVASWVDIEHHETGRHNLPAGNSTARDALADKEAGILFLGTDGGLIERYDGAAWDAWGLVVPGMMMYTAFLASTQPRGWLECNGQAVLQATYPALFAAIGGAFDTQGGAGSPPVGQFRVPNAGGRVAVGLVTGGDGDGDWGTLADEEGSKTHVLTLAEMADHNHGGATSGELADGAGISVSGGTGPTPIPDLTGTHSHTITGAGGDAAHENRQLSFVVGMLIKT